MADLKTFVQQMLGFNRTEELGISGVPTLALHSDDPRRPSINNRHAAFRTITKMLADLERNTPVHIGDNLRSLEDSKARLQLKLSDAFGQLAVGRHEIVAVTTRISEPNVLKVLITKNYTRDDGDTLLPPTAHPIISSPLEPNDLIQGQSAFDYMTAYTTNCENYW